MEFQKNNTMQEQTCQFTPNPECMYLYVAKRMLQVRPQMIEAVVKIHNEVDFTSSHAKANAENIFGEYGIQQHEIDAVTDVLAERGMTFKDFCTQDIVIKMRCQSSTIQEQDLKIQGQINIFKIHHDSLLVGKGNSINTFPIPADKKVYFDTGKKTSVNLDKNIFDKSIEKQQGDKQVSNTKIFIVPENDLESVEILKMLRENGYQDNVNLFVTGQQWGASWQSLEDHIKEAIKNAAPETVYGVELKGESPYINVDHHVYRDVDWSTGTVLYEEDRSKDKNGIPKETAIEQVARIVGVEMTQDMLFVAANDAAFIEGMQKLGEKLGMSHDDLSEKISEIRMREHKILAQAQGITQEMEDQAVTAIRDAEFLANGTLVVELPHDKCSTVTDRIPEQEYEGGLLIMCGNGEIDYYGPSEIVEELMDTFGGWSGNTEASHTFWGTTSEVDRDKLFEIADGQGVEQSFSQEIDDGLDVDFEL